MHLLPQEVPRGPLQEGEHPCPLMTADPPPLGPHVAQGVAEGAPCLRKMGLCWVPGTWTRDTTPRQSARASYDHRMKAKGEKQEQKIGTEKQRGGGDTEGEKEKRAGRVSGKNERVTADRATAQPAGVGSWSWLPCPAGQGLSCEGL